MNYSERLHITVKARLKMFETFKQYSPNQKDLDPMLEEYHKLIAIAETNFCDYDCGVKDCHYVRDCELLKGDL